jgi:hypothetical protein
MSRTLKEYKAIDYNGGQIYVDKKAEIKAEDIVYQINLGEVMTSVNQIHDCWKVVAQSPNLSLEGIPYVEIEEDVVEIARKMGIIFQNEREELLFKIAYKAALAWFKIGYKAASAKKYTHEDILAAYNAGNMYAKGTVAQAQEYRLDTFLKSLQPKVVSIEVEMEKKSSEDIQIELGIYGHDEGLTEREYEDYKSKHSIFKPKTYTKDGKTFLKVKKVNYENQ